MRVRGPDIDLDHVYQIGLFDTKVTIHAQQVRAFNLAWALRSEGVVTAGSRVAIVGGGAAGLSLVAGLYGSNCKLTLFERGGSWMRLQARNHTRYLHPNIYEWPKEPLTGKTFDLPDLSWRANYSREVAKIILRAFHKYATYIDDRRGARVHPVILQHADRILLTSTKDDVEQTEEFDVLVFACGFGLERAEEGFQTYSYWNNDNFTDQVLEQTQPDLVVGCGDGGLTDIIRLSLHDFDHEALEDLARLPQAIALGRELAVLEAAATNATEHHRIYETLACNDEILGYLRDHFQIRAAAVETSDGSGRLYGTNGARLNKLIVRHLVELKAVAWRDFHELSESDPTDPAKRRLKRDLVDHYNRVVVRFGPVRPFKEVCPGVTAPADPDLGYRLGSEAFFPNFYFDRPDEAPSPSVLVLTVGASGTKGGGSEGELKEVELILERELHHPVNVKLVTKDPKISRYGSLLEDIKEAIVTHQPEVILIMGSDLMPIISPRLRKTYRLLAPGKAASESILSFAGSRPVVFFGAEAPSDQDMADHPNLYVVIQKVEDEDIVEAMQQGFPRTHIEFVLDPLRYPIDFLFWKIIRQTHKRLAAGGRVSYTFGTRWVWGQWSSITKSLERRHRRQRLVGQHLFIGRMTAHMLSAEANAMDRVPFLSSYGEDLSRGAIVTYDNDNQACAREIVLSFLKPLLEGREPHARSTEIWDRSVRGKRIHAMKHGIDVHPNLKADGW